MESMCQRCKKHVSSVGRLQRVEVSATHCVTCLMVCKPCKREMRLGI